MTNLLDAYLYKKHSLHCVHSADRRSVCICWFLCCLCPYADSFALFPALNSVRLAPREVTNTTTSAVYLWSRVRRSYIGRSIDTKHHRNVNYIRCMSYDMYLCISYYNVYIYIYTYDCSSKDCICAKALSSREQKWTKYLTTQKSYEYNKIIWV